MLAFSTVRRELNRKKKRIGAVPSIVSFSQMFRHREKRALTLVYNQRFCKLMVGLQHSGRDSRTDMSHLECQIRWESRQSLFRKSVPLNTENRKEKVFQDLLSPLFWLNMR